MSVASSVSHLVGLQPAWRDDPKGGGCRCQHTIDDVSEPFLSVPDARDRPAAGTDSSLACVPGFGRRVVDVDVVISRLDDLQKMRLVALCAAAPPSNLAAGPTATAAQLAVQ
jgi:hypothetical protein